MTPLLVSLAGSLGAVNRFVLDGYIRQKFDNAFPWATILINVSGSLLLGFVTGLLTKHHGWSTMESIVGIGYCGGYTTFSTASYEFVRLLQLRRTNAALINLLATLVPAILAAGVGVVAGQSL